MCKHPHQPTILKPLYRLDGRRYLLRRRLLIVFTPREPGLDGVISLFHELRHAVVSTDAKE